MKLTQPSARLALPLFLVALLLSNSVRAQNFDGWTPPPAGTNTLNATLSGSFKAKGPDTGSSLTNQWRVLLEGTDIYGNSVAIPLASGTINPLLGGSNAQTATIDFSGTIPNDGTLHKAGDNGYRLNLYFGTNVTVTSAGAIQAGQSGYIVAVTPDLAIPPVAQITKIRATATATVVAGEVTALTVVNAGQGYDPFVPPSVTFSGGGGGSGAAATAVIDPETGSILRFNVTSKGTGYSVAPTVVVANTPSTQTQRTGGVLYGYNEQTGKFNYVYNSGDTVRFQTTLRNNSAGDGSLQSRPMRTSASDRFRLRTVLTVDPAYTGSAGDDDLLVFDQVCFGDMAGYPDELTEIRTVRAFNTPPAVPVHGLAVTTNAAAPVATAQTNGLGRVTNITVTPTNVLYNPFNPPAVTVATTTASGLPTGGSGATAIALLNPVTGALTNVAVVSQGLGYTNVPAVTIAPPRYGARYYQPLPDDGFLDIGEDVQLGYDVLMPQRYPGIFYVAAKIDALDEINEPIGFSPGRESPPRDAAALRNNNTFVSEVATRVQILSGPGPGLATVSQVTDSSGAPLIQSDGFSDMASVSADGGYVAFESYARDLAVSQSEASTRLGPTLTNFPPLWSQLSPEVQSALAAGRANGSKQIFRRNTATRQTEIISVSSSGEQAAGDAQNSSITADGRQVAFESRAANLVPNDTGGSSDVFVRRLDLLRTVRVSVNASGIQGNAGSFTPSISGNGRFVAFSSVADNLDLSNPKQSGAGSQQIYVHDRDVSNSGTYDTVGNVRTYLVSVTPVGGGSAATATATVSGGKITGLSVTSGGSGYVASSPPAVFLTGGEGTGARATANVSSGGEVSSFTITDAGAGYTSAPTVTITPRAQAANGWSDTPKISEDGNYLTFVSYSSNLPKTASGAAIGDDGWRGVVYRVGLFQGSPVVSTMQAASVDTAGTLANALSYEPVINGDGSQIAFTSLSDNLVADDSNAFADVFVRDFAKTNTVRVSESLNRFAIGTIRFASIPTSPQTPPDNNPHNGDEFVLSANATDSFTFVFTNAPTPASGSTTYVLIGATASASRDNLVRAINSTTNTNTSPATTPFLAAADDPASANVFYPPTSRVPGQANAPGLFIAAAATGTNANVDIVGNFTVVDSVEGLNTGVFPNGNIVLTTGMRLGGTQADDDAGEFDGVPGGSTMPSIDRSGMVVAFRSTMQTLDVFNRTYNGLNGLRPGDLIRMLRNASGNVYVRARDVDGSGSKQPDALDNVDTRRVSVNKFGYATYGLANVPSSANSHKPAVSALGRYISFSSDAENNGGLAFGRTNLDPQDNNGYRDVYLHDRDVTAEPPVIVVNNPPDVTLTQPSWVTSRELSVGSTITVNALVTDVDEELDVENVTFFVNGEQVPAQARYGNYFSAKVQIRTISSSNVIQARALDNSGASNNSTTSSPITFATINPIQFPTSVTMLPLRRGTILQVGQPVELVARATGSSYTDFYVNGYFVGTSSPSSDGIATFTWYPSTASAVVVQAVARTETFTVDSNGNRSDLRYATLYSNELPSVTVLGVNESAPTGTPEQVVVSIFQTVLSRPPTGTENNYWVNALSTGAVTPTGMVLQLVAETEYNNLQNTLFGYYYRLNTAPSSTTYLRNLNAMEAALAPLPAGGQPLAANGTIASPYGATDGDATAAQLIIDSAAFATANPGVQTMANNSYLTWYYNRWGGQLGNPIDLATAMTTYTPLAESKGYSTALISALYYAARDQTAFNYQLKATSLRWLFTGVWSAPTAPAVTTQAQFEAFVGNLVDSSLGVSTWSWVYANGLTGNNATAEANPAMDGISNLKKYAFNMDPDRAYTGADSVVTPTGTSGLPLVTTVSDSGIIYLQITYVRRISENSISYTPQFSSSLTDPVGWQSATEQPAVTPIDSIWERVTVRDSLPQGAAPARFGRVQVSSSFWMP
jgi:hypothetical protein